MHQGLVVEIVCELVLAKVLLVASTVLLALGLSSAADPSSLGLLFSTLPMDKLLH
jgi:hypothetical protein